MTFEKLLKDIKNESVEYGSPEFIEDLLCENCKCISYDEHLIGHRWYKLEETIFEYGNKLIAFYWRTGLTEYQESDPYCEVGYVKPVEGTKVEYQFDYPKGESK